MADKKDEDIVMKKLKELQEMQALLQAPGRVSSTIPADQLVTADTLAFLKETAAIAQDPSVDEEVRKVEVAVNTAKKGPDKKGPGKMG